MKRLEAATYIILIAVCVLLGIRLWQYHPVSESATTQPSPAPLTNVSTRLPVDLSPHRKWLVMALSTQCHYCSESVPFYRDLQTKSLNDVGLLAVFPQNQSDVATYEKLKGFSPTTVPDFPLSKLQVRGTPTLFLVDQKGNVLRSWIGTLTDKEKLELLEQIKS